MGNKGKKLNRVKEGIEEVDKIRIRLEESISEKVLRARWRRRRQGGKG